MRRNISSFFSWLEDEDYILKSPVRRIHKVKTGTNIKETYTDEALELMRDSCTQIRDLAMIDMLDGATFPHIVTVKYTVDGNEIVRKKWLKSFVTPPSVNEQVAVIYRTDKPTKFRLEL